MRPFVATTKLNLRRLQKNLNSQTESGRTQINRRPSIYLSHWVGAEEAGFAEDESMREQISRFDGLEEWLVTRMGRKLESGVFETPEDAHPEPLLAHRIGELSMMRVVESLADRVKGVVNRLSEDELFSIFGAFEISRVTLGHEVSIFGPSLYYFGDAESFQPCDREIAVPLTKEEVDQAIDAKIFWHCDWEKASANFGVHEGDRVVALTTVWPREGPVYEIGVDVAPGSGLRGLGRAVMSAACRWILDREGLILACSAQWNIPSVRLLRSMGLRYVLSDLSGRPLPFKVPPQPLGKPLPDVEIHDIYPLWAQNKDIIRKD